MLQNWGNITENGGGNAVQIHFKTMYFISIFLNIKLDRPTREEWLSNDFWDWKRINSNIIID